MASGTFNTGGLNVGSTNSEFTVATNGNIDANGNLDVAGTVDLAASAVLTNIRGTLSVDESAIFDTTITVTGNSDLNGTLDVAGTVDLGASGGAADTTVRGDLTVDENLNVTGNAIITGNLTVDGTTTSLNTVVHTVEDNLIVANSTPSTASRDSGLLVQRFQAEVDDGSGDVVADTAAVTGTAQAGAASSITLAVGSNGSDDFYNNWYVKLTGGTGVNQVRKISDYNGTTKVATVNTAWTTNPDATSTYGLYNKPYVGSFYDESADEWVFAATTSDPGASSVVIQDNLNLRIGGLTLDDNADLNGNLDVAGTVDLAASAVLTNVRGTLSVDEAATFDSSVTATGQALCNGGTGNDTAANVAAAVIVDNTNVATNTSGNFSKPLMFGDDNDGNWRIVVKAGASASASALVFQCKVGGVWTDMQSYTQA